jgi:UDP-N-acetyl-D-glucosamine dehydrogenase
MLCDRMSIDIWEVIDAAATKPYGFMPFYPGPGVGGHCIPVDPYYLSWKAREFDFHTKFIDLAAETNLVMPFYTVARIRRMLDRAGQPLTGARLLLIGASFKRDIDDARNSAAVRVMEILKAEGADIRYHDPHVSELRLSSTLFGHDSELKMRSIALTAESLAAADCVVILVAHSLVDWKLVRSSAKLVFDAVNALDAGDRTAASERL